MKLYLLTICISMLGISAVNIAFNTAAWYYVIIAVIWCTAMQFCIDGLFAILINKMPDRWFGVDNRLYNVSKTEHNFYKALKVRCWRDKVWELGGLGGFSKSRVKEPKNPEYIEKYIIECNKGVLTHRVAYPLGFLVMFTLSAPCSFTIALPVATVNLFLNILPTIVLRYNTPLLKSILVKLQKK